MDRLHPAVNRRFVTEYVRQAGGCVDALYGPVQLGMVLRSPRLLWWLFAGAFFPQPGYMVCVLTAE